LKKKDAGTTFSSLTPQLKYQRSYDKKGGLREVNMKMRTTIEKKTSGLKSQVKTSKTSTAE